MVGVVGGGGDGGGEGVGEGRSRMLCSLWICVWYCVWGPNPSSCLAPSPSVLVGDSDIRFAGISSRRSLSSRGRSVSPPSVVRGPKPLDYKRQSRVGAKADLAEPTTYLGPRVRIPPQSPLIQAVAPFCPERLRLVGGAVHSPLPGPCDGAVRAAQTTREFAFERERGHVDVRDEEGV